MKHRRLFLTVAILLALIWGGVAIVMYLTDDYVSWPDKVAGLMEKVPWRDGKDVAPDVRQRHLQKIIVNVNRLDFQQRRQLREDSQPIVDSFFGSLTAEEQREYVNRTIDPHLDVIAQGLKAMSPEERKRMTSRTRSEVKNLRSQSADGDRLAKQDQEFIELMMEEDPALFLRELPTKHKMELGPLLEEMHSRVQGMRR